MLVELTCIVGGFLCGMTYAQNRDWGRYQRTREEVKKEVSAEFEYYKNLSESLKQDLHYYKSKLGQKDK